MSELVAWPGHCEASAIAVGEAPTLPPTSLITLEKVAAVQKLLMRVEQIHLTTEHVLHGGMYSRTIRLPADVVITGSLMKLPTMLIVNGEAAVLAGDEWVELRGYNVLPGSAGRKQICITRSPVEITMIFPTSAKTAAEAEAEFTDEADLLMSRRQQDNDDLVVITGE